MFLKKKSLFNNFCHENTEGGIERVIVTHPFKRLVF